MSTSFAVHPLTPEPPRSPWSAGLTDVVEVIGSEPFPARVLNYLNAMVGADHCAIFMSVNRGLDEIASVGLDGRRGDPQLAPGRYDIKRQLSQVGLSSARIIAGNPPGAEANARLGGMMRQHILLCRRKPQAAYCVQLLRPAKAGDLSDEALEALRNSLDLLMSMIARHADLTVQRSDLTPALRSLTEIQACILEATDLSRREAEVCSRILYGLTSCGIALDLGIGKESVMTYRKRAYHRIGIGSQRELLMWYLALWSGADRPDAELAAEHGGEEAVGTVIPFHPVHAGFDACR